MIQSTHRTNRAASRHLEATYTWNFTIEESTRKSQKTYQVWEAWIKERTGRWGVDSILL